MNPKSTKYSAAEDAGTAEDVVEVVEAMKRTVTMEDRPTVTDAAAITIMATARPVISSVARAANKVTSGGPHTVLEDEAVM